MVSQARGVGGETFYFGSGVVHELKYLVEIINYLIKMFDLFQFLSQISEEFFEEESDLNAKSYSF